MTNPAGPPTTSSPLKRYGPIAAIVVVLVVIAGVVVLAGGDDSADEAQTTGTANGGAAAATVPITYQQAEADGTVADITWVDNCDPETGRIQMPTVYAPPCVPKFEGDNGGATATGVTADAVKVVFYQPQQNADALAALAGATDEPEVAAETRADFFTMFNGLVETYGRDVQLEVFQATGAADDATAAQADATSIIDMEPFAVIGGPTTPEYADEITGAGIVCIACGAAVPDQFYQDHAPYMWGAGPSTEQYLGNFADFIQNRVLGRKAEFAGDPELQQQDRVIGSVNYDQDPPVFNVIRERILECGGTLGYEPKVQETYVFDMGTMPERAATVIAKMKAEGVTTVIFLGDPIMPIYLTQQATAQDYHPEWIIAGTALTDTTALARRYDQEQWAHAFGLSNLAARTPRELAGSYLLHEWYFGRPPSAANTNAVIYSPVSQLFLGIHMAGANLTPESFKEGMFNYPTSGGGPTTPTISYGPDTGFTMYGPNCEPDLPRPDFLTTNDTTEIWWDATATGVDEQGKEGTGMWVYANGGKRYGPGEMPTTPTDAFKRENTVTLFSEVPAEDRAPDYPSPNPNASS
jgi:hypothetical protein